MRVLSNPECDAWFSSHNINVESAERLSLPDQGFGREFANPQQSKTQIVLAHALAEWFDYAGVFFWMSTWPHYEPQEMDLFLRWRRRFGNNQNLIEAPGHLFDNQASESLWEMAEILLFPMSFNWEGYFMAPKTQSVIWIGDDMSQIITQEEEKDESLGKLLDSLNIDHRVTLSLPT